MDSFRIPTKLITSPPATSMGNWQSLATVTELAKINTRPIAKNFLFKSSLQCAGGTAFSVGGFMITVSLITTIPARATSPAKPIFFRRKCRLRETRFTPVDFQLSGPSRNSRFSTLKSCGTPLRTDIPPIHCTPPR